MILSTHLKINRLLFQNNLLIKKLATAINSPIKISNRILNTIAILWTLGKNPTSTTRLPFWLECGNGLLGISTPTKSHNGFHPSLTLYSKNFSFKTLSPEKQKIIDIFLKLFLTKSARIVVPNKYEICSIIFHLTLFTDVYDYILHYM